MKLDLHLHSNHSADSVLTPKTIMKTTKKLALTVAITDHCTTSAWPVFEKLSKEMSWPVIFGEEIKVMEKGRCIGEIVGLFLKEEVSVGGFEEVFEKIHSQGGLAMVVHPFDVFRRPFKHLKKAVNKIDLLEVFNARTTLDSHNEKAEAFALENSLPQVSNSDSHTPKEIGGSYTQVNADTLEQARRELIRGNTFLVKKKSPFTVHFSTQLAKLNLIKDA